MSDTSSPAWNTPENFHEWRASLPQRFANVAVPGRRSFDEYAAFVAARRPQTQVAHSLAEQGALNLWDMMNADGDAFDPNGPFFSALGTISGGQAVEYVGGGGLKAIYLSGWQTAADANTAHQVYPDQSLYPVDSVPTVIRGINNALLAAEASNFEEYGGRRLVVPIVADVEAGFGGPLNTLELAKACIEAGAAGVHFEDQLASEKKCGHMGGKVVIPGSLAARGLRACRLAADIAGTPTIVITRTDIRDAKLITNDLDDCEREFINLKAGRTAEGFLRFIAYEDEQRQRELITRRSIVRICQLLELGGADLFWVETKYPDLEEARQIIEGVRERFPWAIGAYNCSPSFLWKNHMSRDEAARFQRELWAMGYRYIFITLAGWHANKLASHQMARAYADEQMAAFYDHQIAAEQHLPLYLPRSDHQRAVNARWYDEITQWVSGGSSDTTSAGGTEAQFK